ETAQELGAPLVRVWAGAKGSADADAEYRERIAQESRRIAGDAAHAGIAVTCEFHGGALTDTTESAERFCSEVAHDNMKSYWQPNAPDTDSNIRGLEAMLPWLSNIHAFNWVWHESGIERLPMADAADAWKRYLEVAASTGREHFVLVEYVKGDAPEAFLEDAAALKSWIAG
ncbi:MAG: TIM barrel protein, partial [Planctomycetes bacterium]|nr:TIM barrel protein [Planctomycetota bacterium]